MNYFELFELPVSLQVDKEVVRRKYLQLSRQFHPDYFVNEGEVAQQEALERSAALHKALQTFNSREETVRYVLQLNGLLEEEEKYNLPPDFLMEVMELNEEADELSAEGGDPGRRMRLMQQMEELDHEIYAPVQGIVEGYQEGVTSEKALLQVKDWYFKRKYLQRLRQGMAR